MVARICDRCGRALHEGELRYVARIEVFAAADDPLTITVEDLIRDHSAEIDTLLRRCEGMTEEELMRDVHVAFQFDLCRACQQVLVRDPLPPVEPGR